MKVRDLKAVCLEEVCIYECLGEMKYHEVFNGLLRMAPEEILRREVKLIGAFEGKQEIAVC